MTDMIIRRLNADSSVEFEEAFDSYEIAQSRFSDLQAIVGKGRRAQLDRKIQKL
jgi:hypothetical protein